MGTEPSLRNESVARQNESHSLRTHKAVSPWLRPPSLPAVFFLALSISAPLLLQKPMLNSDGDLARHLRHGHYMLEHGGLIRTDPFSFTRPGAPFTGFEYGSQLLFALAENLAGLAGVVLLSGLLIALTYTLLARFLLRRGVDPLLTCVCVGLSIVLGVEHWMARPHLFSFVAVVVLLGLLESSGGRAILGCAALFLIWANLHGGFAYGFMLIGLYLLGSLGELIWSGDPGYWRTRLFQYGTMLSAGLLATLINPFGIELHQHLLKFFNQPFLVDNTAEFVSPNFHEPGARVFLTILVIMVSAFALHARRLTLPHLLVIVIGIGFALISVRNIPLFGLTALPLATLELNSAWQRSPDPGGLRKRFASTAELTSTSPWLFVAILCICALAASRGRVGSRQLLEGSFDPAIFPVNAVAEARGAGLTGHLFTPLPWGGYILYAWPEQKVFIDGGTDFYGEEVFREYVKIRELRPGWRNLLDKHEVSLMLLQPHTTIAHELVRDPLWAIWYCDSTAVLFQRAQEPDTLPPDLRERRLDQCGTARPRTLRNSNE
jgi:hypothetical protein